MNFFTTFASGSSGNCAFYQSGDMRALIDAGTTAKHITACLKSLNLEPSDLTHIFLTHGHNDHISALPVLSKRTNALLCCTAETSLQVSSYTGERKIFSAGQTLCECGIKVHTFKTSHDIAGSCGYAIDDGDQKVGICTDLGHITKSVSDGLCGCQTVLIESNHDLTMLMFGNYPYPLKVRVRSNSGHLSNEQCANFCATLYQSGTRNFVLCHLSEQNNTPHLALTCTTEALTKLGAEISDLSVSVAPPRAVAPLIAYSAKMTAYQLAGYQLTLNEIGSSYA